MPSTCTGPSCSRPVVALDVCVGHYSQKRRGQPLAPLRSGPALARISLRVPATVKRAVDRDAAGARAALEAWAGR